MWLKKLKIFNACWLFTEKLVNCYIVTFGLERTLPFFFFFFLGPHLWHMEVPRLGVKSELQLLATAMTMQDLSLFCDLHHSSQQCRILNPLSEARDGTHVLVDTSGACYR